MKEILILIILIGLLGGLYFYKTTNGGSCEILEEEIKEKLDEINTCKVDSDCKVGQVISCPFGCEQLHNKNVKDIDLAYLKDKFGQYENTCAVCDYDCIMVEESMVKCISGKCEIKTS